MELHFSAPLRHSDSCPPGSVHAKQENRRTSKHHARLESWFLQSLNIHKLARQQYHKASGQLQQPQPLQGHWYRMLQWCSGVLPRLTPLHGCKPWGSHLAKRAPAAEGGGLPTQNLQGLYTVCGALDASLAGSAAGLPIRFRSRHSQVCLLQEQVDSLQSDLEALRQKDRDRVAHFKDKARKQVIKVSLLSRVQLQYKHAGNGGIVGDASAACCMCHHTQEASATGQDLS